VEYTSSLPVALIRRTNASCVHAPPTDTHCDRNTPGVVGKSCDCVHPVT
jgi:hypothetical protein